MSSEIAAALFRSLRAMDAEATTQATHKGKLYTTGLYWYDGHWNADPSRRRIRGTEPAWTRRLPQILLDREGLTGEEQRRYPGSSKTCDLVVRAADGQTLWVEVKAAFKYFWVQQGNLAIYRKHLLAYEGSAWTNDGSAARDIKKLESLHAPDADAVGFLLVGFDSEAAPMDDDIRELQELVKLDQPPWSLAIDQWTDMYRPGLRDRCWFWWRPTMC